MVLRNAHGAGAAYASLVSEPRPLDEIPSLNASDTARGLALAARRGRPFQRGNAAAKGRKPALASAAGFPLDAQDPEYRRALRSARRYRDRRIRELAVEFGGELSSAVCAIITSASLDLAAARYLTSLAARTGDPELLIKASRLHHGARQGEIHALDIASLERRPPTPVDPLAGIVVEPLKTSAELAAEAEEASR